MSSSSFSARIAALDFAKTAVADSKRGRLSERDRTIVLIEEEIQFLRLCEKHKQAVAIVLGLSGGQ